MVGHGQGSSSAIGTLAKHGDVITLPNHHEAQRFERFDDTLAGRIDRELRHLPSDRNRRFRDEDLGRLVLFVEDLTPEGLDVELDG